MKKTIKAKPGSRYSDKDAVIISKFLDKTFPNGEYTPEQIVEAARDKKSEIHRFFNWDDAKAAHLYRLDQARLMVRCLVVITDGGKTMPKAVHVKVDCGDGKTLRTYMNVDKAKDDTDLWKSVVDEAFQGLVAWKYRYERFANYKDFKGVFASIGKLEKKYGKSQKSRSKPRRSKNSTAGSKSGNRHDHRRLAAASKSF